MKITYVKTKKLESNNKNLVGLAKIVLDDCFAIKDIRIIQGKSSRGMFVAFPSRKQQSGEFKDICHPINANTRKYFENIILADFIAGESNENINN